MTFKKVFQKKQKYFDEFKKRDNINLILGSSLYADAIIPDSMGSNWFSFTNGQQNIYESYKFVKYHINSVKIDTIILGLTPFDFPYSYISGRDGILPYLNGNFHTYGSDSITKLDNNISLKIQVYKDIIYRDLETLLFGLREETFDDTLRDVWSVQGFSNGSINFRPFDLDSLFIISPEVNYNLINLYFHNVEVNPNFYYFDLFDNLAKELGVTIIYLITPKSKHYYDQLNKDNKAKLSWKNILIGLEKRKVNLLNYEQNNTFSDEKYYFTDPTHASYKGAKLFSKVLKSQINNL